ncbi:MAG: discoidin domain-containing protein [Bacteroidetes bacterium]|nr:discoidin domain-containing protein [Bacteroidota bacterium]
MSIYNQNARSQTYLKFVQTTNSYQSFTSLSAVTQSSGTAPAVSQMIDLNYGNGAQTNSAVNSWIQIDMGSARNISYVDVAAKANVAYLNARNLQVSTNGTTWTTVATNMTGTSLSALKRFSFTSISARYVRVYNPAAAAGIVGVSEIIPESISKLIVAPAQANTVSAVADIGFNFSFNGTTYTKFSTNSNGLLRLGTTVATNEAANNFTSTANSPKIFALWDDIATGTLATNGGVRVWNTGSSPNRVLIADWKCNKANSTAGAVDINFQILFYEGTNKIEFVYGSGVSVTSASIGLGTTNVATQYMSVTPGSPANVKYYTQNNAVTAWPGSGVSYTFTPTALTSSEAVPGGNFATIENAVGALNWIGPPTGGITVTVAGNHTEKAPAGISTTTPAGLLITTTGTASKPISFVWSGSGAKPIIYAGSGIGNIDYVLGIDGGDYITIDGLSIVDSTTHLATYTAAQHTAANNLHAEIGIGLFKKLYNTTTGNNGCNNVTIKNCSIDLSRFPNQVTAYSYDGYWFGISKYFWSRGIYAARYTSTGLGQVPTWWNMFDWNTNGGILSQNDVHQNCTITGNTINDCSKGIEWDDAFLRVGNGTTTYAGTNNKIGISGAGNTITNWGPEPSSKTAAYTYTSSGTYGRGSHIAGISMSGQKDFTIEYNTVSNCEGETGTTAAPTTMNSHIQNYVGILVGRTGMNQKFPINVTGFFIKINNNTVSNIDVTKSNATSGASSNPKSAQGIVVTVQRENGQTAALFTTAGDININNNTISNLKTISGDCRGISTKMLTSYLGTRSYVTLGTAGDFEWDYLNTTGNYYITYNTIKGLTQIGNTNNNNTLMGHVEGILFGSTAKRAYIENNTIGGSGTDGITVGTSSNTFLNAHVFGVRGILVDATNSCISRDLLSVKNNTITNIDRLAGTISTYTLQRAAGASAILVYKGATVNNIDGNTISGMDIANGLYGSVSNNGIEIIRVAGIPKSGTSTVNIMNNSITSINRNKFGNLTSMAAGSGLYSYTTCISAENIDVTQTKNIYNNTIDGVSQTATVTTNQSNYYSVLDGIKVRGKNVAGSSLNVYGNTIKNFSGDNWNYTGGLSTTSANNHLYNWNVVGIRAMDYTVCNIYANSICGLTTTHTGGTANTSVYAHGVTGIMLGKTAAGVLGTKTTIAEAVYNNMISDLTAPSINSLYAVQGIYYWGYGAYGRISHNTIAIGDPAAGGTAITTSSANSFGASGITLNNVYSNNATYPVELSNNLISVNVTPKGSTGSTVLSASTTGGFGTVWRHIAVTTAGKKPLGIASTSTGNVYYINDHIRNYYYAQGSRYYNTGIVNGYGYYINAPTTYKNTTYNLVNDTVTSGKFFNNICGRYKSFWGNNEKGSFFDISAATPPHDTVLTFVNSGSNCTDKLKLVNGSSSYAGSAFRISSPLNISTDFFGTSRGATNVTAGAHENSSVSGSPVYTMQFTYDPICDGVCTGNKTLTVNILPPAGKTIETGWKKPRLYFRRIKNASTISAAASDNNVMVDSVNNTSTGTEGWRYVKATAISGNDYTFVMDMSILKSTISTAVSYTIEYFVIAETTDGTICNWTSGDLASTCPSTVIMSTGGASNVPTDPDGDAAILTNSVDDNFTIYTGTELTKSLVALNNSTTYTANNGTAISVCIGDSAVIAAKHVITALGTSFNDACVTYKLQVATNTAFTTGLDSITSTDSIFRYPITSTTTKYFRVSLDCGGSIAANTISPYIAFKGIQCPSISTAIANQTVCDGNSMSLSVSRAGAVSEADAFLFVDPHGKAYPKVTTAVSSGATIVGPIDTTQEGTWTAMAIKLQNSTIPVQGVNASTLVSGNISGDAIENKGLLFDVREPIKLNSVIVRDAGTDAATTTDFNIQLLDSSANLLFEQTGPASVADDGSATITFTNLYIPPGTNYMLVLAPKSGVSPTGDLTVVSPGFPISVTNGAVTIQGGVEGADPQNITGDYNYFFSWDVDIYCEGADTNFNVVVKRLPTVTAGLVDSITVCAGDSVVLYGEDITGDSLQYQWQKYIGATWTNLSGETSTSLKYLSSTTTNTGSYRLKLTGACNTIAYTDTAVVTVNSTPSAPSAADVLLCGSTGDDVVLTSNSVSTYWFDDGLHTNLLDTGISFTLNGITNNDTIFAFKMDTTSGCYSKGDSARISLIKFLDIPTSVGVHKADRVCIDQEGWAHFYKSGVQHLILSLQLDTIDLGNNLVTNGWTNASSNYEVLIGVEASRKYLPAGNPSYVINPNGWYVMNRYWMVHTNDTDYTGVSKDIPMRFYYKPADYTSLNTSPISMSNQTDMKFYKLPHGYDPAGSNHDNSPTVDSFSISTTPDGTLNEWYLDTINQGYTFNAASMHVKGFSGGGGGAGGSCPACSPLPIQWLNVAAAWKNEYPQVSWDVASEIGVKQYDIYRSVDGLKYELISSKQAIGNNYSTIQYSMIDYMNIPLGTIKCYYKIKQIDYSGASSESKVCVLHCNGNISRKSIVTIEPNPAKSIVSIRFNEEQLAGGYTMTLVDVAGKKLYETKVNNKIETIDISNYNSGVYFIKVSNNGSLISTEKLVIQH